MLSRVYALSMSMSTLAHYCTHRGDRTVQNQQLYSNCHVMKRPSSAVQHMLSQQQCYVVFSVAEALADALTVNKACCQQ